MESQANINAAREPAVRAAIGELNLSGRKGKLVRSTLMGHHGDRIIRDHGGDIVAAARSVASMPAGAPIALRANLSAQSGRRAYTLSREALAQRSAAAAASASKHPREGWATVRVRLGVRDAAGRCLRDGESLADLVGAAIQNEIANRISSDPEAGGILNKKNKKA